MTCEEFWNGDPHAEDHLQECPACASRQENQERLAIGLNALGAQMRRVGAPARVERRLVSAFRAEAELTEMPHRTAWLAVGTWAAALAATLVLAVFLIRGHQPQRTIRITRSVTQLAAVEAPAEVVSGDDGSAGAFLPLPNAEEISPNEPMNLVRLEVRRSAMIPLGFAVSEDRASETIEADVMLGADGVARAVRFLEY